MPIVNRKDVVSNGTPNLPRNTYQARIIDATFGLSKSSGNPMTTLKCELLGQNGNLVVQGVDGKNYSAAGATFSMYLIYTQDTPGGKKGMLASVFDFNDKLGISSEDIDTENPNVEQYKGKEFDIILESKPRTARMRPQPGEKVGQPIKDKDGKDVIQGYDIDAQLQNVLGVASFNYNGGPY